MFFRLVGSRRRKGTHVHWPLRRIPENGQALGFAAPAHSWPFLGPRGLPRPKPRQMPMARRRVLFGPDQTKPCGPFARGGRQLAFNRAPIQRFRASPVGGRRDAMRASNPLRLLVGERFAAAHLPPPAVGQKKPGIAGTGAPTSRVDSAICQKAALPVLGGIPLLKSHGPDKRHIGPVGLAHMGRPRRF